MARNAIHGEPLVTEDTEGMYNNIQHLNKVVYQKLGWTEEQNEGRYDFTTKFQYGGIYITNIIMEEKNGVPIPFGFTMTIPRSRNVTRTCLQIDGVVGVVPMHKVILMLRQIMT